MSLTWEGEKVTAKLRRAMVAGVNRTMAEAVVHAKQNHAWRNRTGTLEGGIQIAEYARKGRGGVFGLWGVLDVRYAAIQEKGGTIRPKTASALFIRDHAGDIAAVVSEVTLPARPYLKPAADATYPSLSSNIRAAYEAGA